MKTALINFDNIPGGEIGLRGLDTEMLKWVSEASSTFAEMLESEELPFLNDQLSSDVVEELNRLEKDSIPKSSQKQTDSTIKRFQCFLRQHNLSDDLINQ